MFPFNGLLPSHYVGGISLLVLAVALLARYAFALAGALALDLRRDGPLALYFNAFVGVVQAFQKLAFLRALAPTAVRATVRQSRSSRCW